MKINFPTVNTEVVILDGGMNEAVSSLEMKPGELISCKNYYIIEGATGGYVSIPGYERYDGQESPTSIAATELDDTDRENARDLIEEVPGTGPIRGIHIFEGKVYAFRDKDGSAEAGMFVETDTGWKEVDTSSGPLKAGGRYSFINYNFSGSALGYSMFWTNGVDKAGYFDGTTFGQINNSGMASDTPLFLAAHGDRIFLSYPDGSLQYSNVGDPTNFSTGAGEIGVGFDITALTGSVGDTLLVFGLSNIKVLEGSDTTTWTFKHFSDVVGAYPYTVCKLFDTAIFMSDMGITTLSAAQEFGDFATNSISEKIKKTLFRYKNNITCATVAKNLNQYRLFFDNGKFIIFSFNNKKIRGATICQYPASVETVTEGKNTSGDISIFFGSTTGYVYHSDTGTSFDGGIIPYSFSTSYYHYKSPRNWKRFLRVTFEIYSIDPITFNIKPSFDYSLVEYSKAASSNLSISGAGSVWGEGKWGEMLWAGSDITTRTFYDLHGIGSNMSLSLSMSSKYKKQHTFQNFITDYIILGRQQ